jgi:hypothetical protein
MCFWLGHYNVRVQITVVSIVPPAVNLQWKESSKQKPAQSQTKRDGVTPFLLIRPAFLNAAWHSIFYEIV